MRDKLFRHHLRQIAEQAIPADIDLWPVIRTQLGTTSDEAQATFTHKRQFRRLVSITLMLLSLTLGVFITPWGQVIAQSLFRFFAIAPNDTFPVPADELKYLTGTPIFVPTFTPLPDCDYLCQLRLAETNARFAIKAPPGDIHGLTFSLAYASQRLQMVTLEYVAVSGGSQLIIRQGPGFDVAKWGEVAPSAVIELVRVGKLEGEYVRGDFAIEPDTGLAVWNPDAQFRRLRWQEGQVNFEVQLIGQSASIEWLNRDQLIELAESLVLITNIQQNNP